MSVLIFFLISYILLSVSLYLLFPKAGVEAWKGLVPGLNFIEWCKIIGRKPIFALWLLFPIVNIFIYAGMCVDMMRSFGRTSFLDAAISVIYAPFAFFRMSKDKLDKYKGPILEQEKEYKEKVRIAEEGSDKYALKKLQKNNPYLKSPGREWAEAIIFAVFAAAFIRMFLIEAYKIPTGSMEGSLLIGDFLFVSKAHYGIRMPQTIAMIPLLHNRIPFINRESYIKKPKLGYKRLPAIENIDLLKPIVFNYPEGDSVYVIPGRTYSIHDTDRSPGVKQYVRNSGERMVVRPMDKRDHYIKRCMGMPGDSIQIKQRQVFINGKAVENPSALQFRYMVDHTGFNLNDKDFDDWGISILDGRGETKTPDSRVLVLNEEQVQKIKNLDENIKVYPLQRYKIRTLGGANIASILETHKIPDASISTMFGPQYLSLTPEQANVLEQDSLVRIEPTSITPVFPMNEESRTWTVDDYGPIYIPKAGATVKLTPQSLAYYERIINVYEGNDFKVEGGKIFINGQETDEYTFKQNYYWAMGDNRHNSEDSRVWGYVPEDHIVGKPLFIWFSTKDGSFLNGINWSRIFTGATKM